jgi:hypothetical protein
MYEFSHWLIEDFLKLRPAKVVFSWCGEIVDRGRESGRCRGAAAKTQCERPKPIPLPARCFIFGLLSEPMSTTSNNKARKAL